MDFSAALIGNFFRPLCLEGQGDVASGLVMGLVGIAT